MPDSPNSRKRLDVLLARLVESTITSEEFEELGSLLHGSEDDQQRYLHYLGLHAEMQEPCALSRGGSEVLPTGRRWSSLAPIAMAAVVAALVVAVALVLRPDPRTRALVDTPGPTPIARIVELNGSVSWTGDGGQLRRDLDVDELLEGGTLETLAQNSWAEIEFLDGSRVWVSGPAVLTLFENDEGKLVRLRHGELSVDVRPQAADSPFRLATASAEVEVLGTQFNVTSDAYTTSVMVNEGTVRVKRLADGKVQEVPADHRVVAALERGSRFEVLPRRQYSEEWRSELPRDLRYGEFRSGGASGAGTVLARPLLWKEDRAHPILLHFTSLRPSEDDLPPVRLTEKTRIHVRGRLDRDHPVVFGVTTLHAEGGFAGKYISMDEITIDRDAGGAFEITLPLSDFKPEKDCFPSSPVGHELSDCWILTIEEDAGLEISRVEVLK